MNESTAISVALACIAVFVSIALSYAKGWSLRAWWLVAYLIALGGAWLYHFRPI